MFDKRQSERVVKQVRAEVVRSEAFQRVSTEVVDVSYGGIRVRTDAAVLTGEDVLMTFRLGERQVDAEGYVARVIHGRRPGENGERFLGVRFTHLDEPSKLALHQWMRSQGAASSSA